MYVKSAIEGKRQPTVTQPLQTWHMPAKEVQSKCCVFG